MKKRWSTATWRLKLPTSVLVPSSLKPISRIELPDEMAIITVTFTSGAGLQEVPRDWGQAGFKLKCYLQSFSIVYSPKVRLPGKASGYK